MQVDWILAGAALKSAAVLGVAFAAGWLLRKRSAAARHLVWTAAFAALLALPFLSLSLPPLRLEAVETVLPPAIAVTNAVAPAAAPQPAGIAPAGQPPAPAPWRPDWRAIALLLWACGAAGSLAHMLAGWAALRRARRSATRLHIPDLSALARPLGIDHSVDVLEMPAGGMPMAFGLFRPAVFIPAGASGWTPERRRLVLLHELAHLRRGDTVTHLVARAALALYWWNPLAWSAWREFLKERERAADDLVLNAGARPSEYAGHLLEIVRSMQSNLLAGGAAVAMARPSQFEGRLLAILDARRDRTAPPRLFALIAAVLAVCMVAPLAALQQQEAAQPLPADLDSFIRAAAAQKNHELLEQAAATAESLRRYDAARKLLESSLAVRAGSDAQGAGYGLAVLRLADLARKRGSIAEAEALYYKALASLHDKPEAARALVGLGIAALWKKDPEKAQDFLLRARLANPRSAQAAMWMAIMREQEGKPEEAEPLYREAQAAADPNSGDAAIAAELLARVLRRSGRTAEAEPLERQAAALWRSQGEQVRPAAAPDVFRVGSGVTPPMPLSKPEPEYTEEARLAKYQGTAVLYVEIGPDGVPRNIRLTRGVGLGLDDKAIEAIRQWTFKPGMKDGQPVTVAATIEVNFRLL